MFCLWVVVASGLVAEIAVRALGLAPPLNLQYANMIEDEVLPYRPRPHASFVASAASGEFSYHVRHNGFGLRDVERSVEKPPGTFRILALGDSFTYGTGAPYDDTYLVRLEELLNARDGDHPRVEIVKAGIPRYYPHPERLLLEHYGLAFDPDMVLVGFTPNDVLDTVYGIDAVTRDDSGFLKTREAKALGDVGTWLFLHSHAARIVLHAVVRSRIAHRYPTRPGEIYQDDGFHEPQWRQIEAEYSRMVELVGDDDARLVVVYIPDRGFRAARADYPAERLGRWAARHQDAAFIDGRAAMLVAGDGEPLHWARDPHCTPLGQAVLARAVFDGLVDRGLVP
jgi:hypothetical protein